MQYPLNSNLWPIVDHNPFCAEGKHDKQHLGQKRPLAQSKSILVPQRLAMCLYHTRRKSLITYAVCHVGHVLILSFALQSGNSIPIRLNAAAIMREGALISQKEDDIGKM